MYSTRNEQPTNSDNSQQRSSPRTFWREIRDRPKPSSSTSSSDNPSPATLSAGQLGAGAGGSGRWQSIPGHLSRPSDVPDRYSNHSNDRDGQRWPRRNGHRSGPSSSSRWSGRWFPSRSYHRRDWDGGKSPGCQPDWKRARSGGSNSYFGEQPRPPTPPRPSPVEHVGCDEGRPFATSSPPTTAAALSAAANGYPAYSIPVKLPVDHASIQRILRLECPDSRNTDRAARGLFAYILVSNAWTKSRVDVSSAFLQQPTPPNEPSVRTGTFHFNRTADGRGPFYLDDVLNDVVDSLDTLTSPYGRDRSRRIE